VELIVAGGRAHDRRVFGAILRRITALQYVRIGESAEANNLFDKR
jgi:hypothetical protein